MTSKNTWAADAAAFAAPASGVVDSAGQNPAKASTPYGMFLRALFATKPAEMFILIWFLGTKISQWFSNVDDAIACVERHPDEDVYAGVALSPAEYGAHQRCKAHETAGIVGLWLDLDYQSEAHKKPNLPPTFEDALGLIPADLPPSIVVHSGHGAQAWWLFPEPRIFAIPEDRQEAMHLADLFKAFFKQRAAAKGWDVDSVADFARVMRVPGTTNTKVPHDHRGVKLIQLNDRRYTPEEIRHCLTRTGNPAPLLPGSAGTPSNSGLGRFGTTSMPSVGEFVLDPMANPPVEKLQLLCDISLEFRSSWNRQRPDMKDQSASSYDQSLANHAAKARWTDQEIVNMLIAHRRKHGDDLKLRSDYFKRTIAKARAAAEEFLKELEADTALKGLLDGLADRAEETTDETTMQGTPVESQDETATQVTPAEPEVHATTETQPRASSERRERILRTLSTKFKVPLKRIVKFTGDDPRYRLETELGDVQLGNVNGLIGQNRLRSSIAASTGKYLPHFDPDLWPGVARLLLEACEDVDRGRDATLIGTMTEWLRAYLRHKQPHESLEEADEGREPFTHTGAVYIFIDNLRHWLGVQQGEKITRNMLTADLRAFGAEPEPFDLDGQAYDPLSLETPGRAVGAGAAINGRIAPDIGHISRHRFLRGTKVFTQYSSAPMSNAINNFPGVRPIYERLCIYPLT